MGWFARLLHDTLNTEMALHVSFCADFGITEEELRATEASPTTLAYTNHLVQTAYSGGAGEAAAAILPCIEGGVQGLLTVIDDGHLGAHLAEDVLNQALVVRPILGEQDMDPFETPRNHHRLLCRPCGGVGCGLVNR